MSRGNLGNKRTLVLHNCVINNKSYDLVITPHRQTIGYIRSKRQTRRKKIINKQFIRKRFSNQRNAVSESETTNIQKLHDLKESINKNYQIDDQIYFSDSEATSPASKIGKRKIKNTYINKTKRLYNCNQPIRHIESYMLTVLRYEHN